MYIRYEYDGFYIYVPDHYANQQQINRSGIVYMKMVSMETDEVLDPVAVTEHYRSVVEKIVDRYRDVLLENGYRHLVVMSLGDYFYKKPKAKVIKLDFNHLLVLFKKRPRKIEFNVLER